jgi:spore coat protein U-like protein
MTAVRIALVAAAAAALAACAAPAAAANCDVSPQGVSFGAYDSLASAPLDGVGNIAVNCNKIVSFTISLSTGGGSYVERRMSGASAQLGYNLYRDASRLIVWGDGSAGSTTVSATPDNGNIPIYGRVRPLQSVPLGSYADTIVVTLTY